MTETDVEIKHFHSLRLLVIDDHPVVLAGVKTLLEGQGWYCMGAATREEAMLLLQHASPVDVVVIDLSLKAPTDGLTLLDELREKGFTGKSIIFTMHDELWNASLIQESDADGIVLKGDDPTELISAINTVMSGGRYISEGFKEIINESLKANSILTDKDIQVLTLVAQGLNNHQIADKIFSSVKTIEYHRSRILLKLEVSSMPEAVAKALSMGIINPAF